MEHIKICLILFLFIGPPLYFKVFANECDAAEKTDQSAADKESEKKIIGYDRKRNKVGNYLAEPCCGLGSYLSKYYYVSTRLPLITSPNNYYF